MGFSKWLVCLAAVTLGGSAAHGDDLEVVATKFGARLSVMSASISPDGNKLVLIGARNGGGENAVVIDLATGKIVPVLQSRGADDRLLYCQFALDTRLVCNVLFSYGRGRDTEISTRLLTVATDGSGAKMLTAPAAPYAYYNAHYGGSLIDYNVAGDPQAVLMMKPVSPEFRTGTLISRASSGLGVEKVDVVTLERSDVESARENAAGYISDGHGRVRVMSTILPTSAGYLGDTVNFSYRRAESRDWESFGSAEIGGTGVVKGFYPVAVDSARNVAYGFDIKDGTTALFQRALDGSGRTELLLHNPNADIDSLIRIGRDQRVVGASYVTEKRTIEYFDPALRNLTRALSRALGGQLQISILDASRDENKLLVLASSDTNPGMLYLYDRTTKKLGELLPLRAGLAGMQLAEMRPVSFPARDGTMIPAYLTLPPGSDGKNLPAIVMPHGGPTARDEWGFDWLVQFFAARGFAVLQPNYRGSTGYGADWLEKNGFQSWPQAMNDIIDAGHWLVQSGTADPSKLAIVGWSYGGYAALQTGVVDPDVFKAIVAIAPVTDLGRIKEETRNQARYRLVEQFVGTGPHVAAGSPARHADRLRAPVLLFHGDRDTNVGVAASRLMRDRLQSAGKSVQYTEFPGLDHQLDNAVARKQMLMESDQFLRKALGL
jgi:dienelactone hydrolase